jgi:hypothetical protein
MVFEPWNPHLQKYGAYALDEYQSQTLKIKRFMIFYLAILLHSQCDTPSVTIAAIVLLQYLTM